MTGSAATSDRSRIRTSTFCGLPMITVCFFPDNMNRLKANRSSSSLPPLAGPLIPNTGAPMSSASVPRHHHAPFSLVAGHLSDALPLPRGSRRKTVTEILLPSRRWPTRDRVAVGEGLRL